MDTAGEAILALVPDVRVVVYDLDTVELRTGVWNCSSVTLSDDEKQGILATIILKFTENMSISQIAQSIGVDITIVSSVAETLIANNMLVSGNQQTRWIPMTSFVGSTLGTAQGMTAVPEKTILLGAPWVTSFIATTLGSVMAERIHFEDEHIWNSLKTQDLLLEADGLEIARRIAPFEGWKDALVVSCASELHPIFLGNLNYLAHQIGFRFLPAVVDGPFAMIGPTVTPGNTACFACAETRVIESLRDHTLYVEYRKALSSHQVYGQPIDRAMDPFLAIMLSFTGWEVLNIMTVGNSFTTNKVLSMYAPTMEIMFHELLRIPGCRVCGKKATLDSPLYADLRSYLSTQLGK